MPWQEQKMILGQAGVNRDSSPASLWLCSDLQASACPLLSDNQQSLELKAAQTIRFFLNPALVTFLPTLWPTSPLDSPASLQPHELGQEMDEGDVLSIPWGPLSRGNTKLGEQPEHRYSGESACLCENTRRQIVDIKILGRLWDWAISFSPHTKGPFLSRCKTETILKGLWNFWAFFSPQRRNGPCSKATDEVGCKGQDVHMRLRICLLLPCCHTTTPPQTLYRPRSSYCLQQPEGQSLEVPHQGPGFTRLQPCPEELQILQEAIC